MKKRILLSNDDGYRARGIEKLAEALSAFAEVTVVAPEVNQSGSSNSLTLTRPLMVRQAPNGFYYINGTPSDCVHIALTGMLKNPPDLVVSGINDGANLGEDTLYSGTVAAATEGYLFGFPAMAFSLVQRNWEHLDDAVEKAAELVQKQLETPRKEPMLLSINIPSIPKSEYKSIKVTRLGRRHPSQQVIPCENPKGEDMYWIGMVGEVRRFSHETDFSCVREGHITVTPLHIDLTSHDEISMTQEWIDQA